MINNKGEEMIESTIQHYRREFQEIENKLIEIEKNLKMLNGQETGTQVYLSLKNQYIQRRRKIALKIQQLEGRGINTADIIHLTQHKSNSNHIPTLALQNVPKEYLQNFANQLQLGFPQQQTQDEEEPLYVNAKQYHRILKRRKARQKLQLQLAKYQNKNKTYLYESRHKHAVKRMRGPGGKFLPGDKKKEEDSGGIPKHRNAMKRKNPVMRTIINGNGQNTTIINHPVTSNQSNGLSSNQNRNNNVRNLMENLTGETMNNIFDQSTINNREPQYDNSPQSQFFQIQRALNNQILLQQQNSNIRPRPNPQRTLGIINRPTIQDPSKKESNILFLSQNMI